KERSMRNFKAFLVMLMLCSFGTLILAGSQSSNVKPPADPILGTWKLNVAKSKFSPIFLALTKTAPLKEETDVCLTANGRIECTFSMTRTDGSTGSQKMSWPEQGGAVQAQGDGIPPTYSAVDTRMATGEWLVTDMIQGRQFGTLHLLISKDG